MNKRDKFHIVTFQRQATTIINSKTDKIVKKEDDCWPQLMILNSPVNIKYRDCSVYAYCRPISHNKFMFLPRVKLFPIHAHLKVLSLSQQTLTFDSQFNQLNIGVSLVYFFVARCVLNEKEKKNTAL